MATRQRQIYQTSLIYTLSGANNCTGAHSSAGVVGNILSATSGTNFVAELYRVQSFNDDWSNQLTDVNQFGELAAIDRVPLSPPTVNLSFNYLLSNLINENLIGLYVGKPGDASQVSCISGILNGTTNCKNYFCKMVDEGNDAIDYNPATYDVRSFGNAYLNSYTVQGQVGAFPTVDVSFTALNAQMQTVTQSAGARIPAVNPNDGTYINNGYVLPTGVTNFNNNGTNTTTNSVSVLRPKDVNISLGLNAGDGFATESDLKFQNFNLSFSLANEDLLKLGTKFAYAKLPKFPVVATLSVNAILGQNATGSLVEIINNNNNFNPSITILSPTDATQTIAYFQLRGAKLDSQNFTQSIGGNQSIALQFSTQIGSAQSTTNGVFMSGVTVT